MGKKISDSFLVSLTFGIAVVSLFLLAKQRGLHAEINDEVPLFSIGASPVPEIQLAVTGGNSQSGRRTLVLNNSINFGNVSFIHPEAIANGDSYLENGHLLLEAVVDLGVAFSGTNSVALELSRLNLSTNPFYRVYHSLTLDRSQKPEETQNDPNRSQLKTLTNTETVSLRLVFEIRPQQTGSISDRFRLEASSR